MRIFVSIDGVIRNTIQKIDYHYKDYYLNTDTESEEEFKYGITEPILNDNIASSYQFQSKDEMFNFLFMEFPVEIFGHAGLSYNRAVTELNEFIYNNSDHTTTVLGLMELGKSKPATLFFLSKNGFMGNSVRFSTYDNIKELWKQCDVWITDDKRVIDECPEGKTVIKFETPYNQHFTNNLKIDKLSQIDTSWLKYSANPITSTLTGFLKSAKQVLRLN